MRKDLGILYVATGERYIAEATQSAQSAKNQMPDVPICLYTDEAGFSSPVFDQVVGIKDPQHFFVDKVRPLTETPFERTLFLDTDTRVCADIMDVFSLLDRFDMALAHAPMRHDRPYPTPNCFAEMNSGVIAYRKNARVEAMFRRWIEIYEEELKTKATPEIGDQVHLRRAIYESDVSLYILPPEYNFRSVMMGFCGRQKVRILHGRGDLGNVEKAVNRTNKMRAVFPSLNEFNADQAIFLDAPGKAFIGLASGMVCALGKVRNLVRKITGR